jgi:F-type H+-transporting ATPase subunit epsilon
MIMTISILSPEKQIYTGEITSVTVPGTTGQFEMLKNHAPIVAALAKGAVKVVKTDGETLNFQIDGGFVEMLNNEVSLLVSGVKNN